MKGTSAGWPAIDYFRLYLDPAKPITTNLEKKRKRGEQQVPSKYKFGWDQTADADTLVDLSGQPGYIHGIHALPAVYRDIPSSEEDFAVSPNYFKCISLTDSAPRPPPR